MCLIWLPAMCSVVLGVAQQNGVLLVIGAKIPGSGHFFQIGLLLCGIQPIVSTCMAMTKSDVRKYTMDLITLSYIRKSSSQETRTESNTNDSPRKHPPPPPSSYIALCCSVYTKHILLLTVKYIHTA
jgi:hypothetical protein